MFVVYTDGACRGNPGPGGYGAIILDDGVLLKEFSGGSKKTTNNRMEMAAAIIALRSLPEEADVIVFSDSKYVVDGITKWIKGWQNNNWVTKSKSEVKNKDLWIKLLMASANKKVEWRWVKGHAGNSKNERCDQLAKAAIPS
jgi:ribonuclease HI